MSRPRFRAALGASLSLLVCAALVSSLEVSTPAPEALPPWPLLDVTWRTDPAWYDGRAEVAEYSSAEWAEGALRDATTTIFTNKQHMDPRRRVKVGVPGEDSLEAFKQHRSERVPAGAFELDLATVTFTNAATLAPFLATFASQDSCGASFKQVWAEAGGFAWAESVYFPGGGRNAGRLRRTKAWLEDQLPLVLRDFPFASAQPGETVYRFDCLPSQRTARRAPWQVEGRLARYAGKEVLGLATGEREAHSIEVLAEATGELLGTYWFAAEGGAPWLHVLLRYEGADGRRLELVSHARDAYWERN